MTVPKQMVNDHVGMRPPPGHLGLAGSPAEQACQSLSVRSEDLSGRSCNP